MAGITMGYRGFKLSLARVYRTREFEGQDKAQRFVIARGECGEVACGLDLLYASELVELTAVYALKSHAGRVAAMLSGLIRRERRLAEAG